MERYSRKDTEDIFFAPVDGDECGPRGFLPDQDDAQAPRCEADSVEDAEEDLDATGRFRIVAQLNLPKIECW